MELNEKYRKGHEEYYGKNDDLPKGGTKKTYKWINGKVKEMPKYPWEFSFTIDGIIE